MQCVQESTDSPFVSCYEEVDYKFGLGSIVVVHRVLGNRTFPTGLTDVFWVSSPYDQLYFIINWLHLTKEADLEYWNQSRES